MRAMYQTAAAAMAGMLLGTGAASAAGSCENVAKLSVTKIANHLREFSGPILGKDATRWTLSDFNNLLTHVAACEGMKSVDGSTIKVESWRFQLTKSLDRVLPVSAALDKVDAEFGRPGKVGLPECVALLDWKNERKSHTNNAAAIFGREFRVMEPAAALEAGRYAKACGPALEVVLKAREYGPAVAGKILADIEETARMEAEAAEEDASERNVRHLQPMVKGRLVPLSYLAPEARKVVDMANMLAEVPGRIPTDRATTLVTWADETLKAGRDDAEMAYAKAVKQLVSRRLFGD